MEDPEGILFWGFKGYSWELIGMHATIVAHIY